MSTKLNTSSNLARAVDELLRLKAGVGLDRLINDELKKGTSLTRLAKRIYVLTEEVVDLPHSTLERWISNLYDAA